MAAAIAAAGFTTGATAQTTSPAGKCTVTAAQRVEARALRWQEFDQTGTAPGSFRALVSAGCIDAALSAYDDWLANGPGYPDARARGIGSFHRGELLAFSGHSDQALAVIRQSLRPETADGPRAGVWNTYVRGVIGFFEGDKARVEAAQAALREEPDDPFATRQVGVLQGLIDCFGQEFRVAMAPPCCR